MFYKIFFALDTYDQGLERIKEVKEVPAPKDKKIRRFTDDLVTYSPKLPKKNDIILDKINLENKALNFKKKKNVNEEKKIQIEDDFEISKNSVNNLQKSFRIRNRRSISDVRETSVHIGNNMIKQTIMIDPKLQTNILKTINVTNKHLLHNKMQKRPDTTGAKNREKKFVIVEKIQQKLQEDKGEKVKTSNIGVKKEEIKEKFKEEFIGKMKTEKEENINFINPLDIKKEFSTDEFDEFKFGELLGEGLYLNYLILLAFLL